MKKEKTIYDLIDYLQIKIVGLQYLELQFKNKKAGELWELNTEENSRLIQEFTFMLSMIKEMKEAEKIKHVIRTPARLSEMSFEMMSEELRKQALKEEMKNKKAIENELKKYK